MVVWAAIAATIYEIGSRALRRRPLVSLPDMIDGQGKVVSPLVPEGLVRIKGELWVAKSADKELDVGTDIIVIAQDSLKLVVQEKGKPEETK